MKAEHNKIMSSKQTEAIFSAVKIGVAMLIAMALAFVIILLVSDKPVEAIRYFLLGPFSSKRHIGDLFANSIPLIFTGLSVCLMFSAGYMTLSMEGVIYFGAMIASSVAISGLNLPGWLMALIAIAIAALVGGVVSSIPIIASLKCKTDPFVFSLLFNFVLLYIGSFVLNNVLKDISFSGIASKPFPKEILFEPVIAGTKIHSGIFIAIACVVLSYIFLYKTKWGYHAKLIKDNRKFAKYAGVNIFGIVVLVQFLGGMMAAIGGGVEMFGKNTRFMWSALPGYGWDGIMVATLAYYNPLLVPIAAAFLGYIRTGADIMNRYTDVANEVVTIIQSVMILLIAAKAMLSKYQQRITVKQAKLRMELEQEEPAEQEVTPNE